MAQGINGEQGLIYHGKNHGYMMEESVCVYSYGVDTVSHGSDLLAAYASDGGSDDSDGKKWAFRQYPAKDRSGDMLSCTSSLQAWLLLCQTAHFFRMVTCRNCDSQQHQWQISRHWTVVHTSEEDRSSRGVEACHLGLGCHPACHKSSESPRIGCKPKATDPETSIEDSTLRPEYVTSNTTSVHSHWIAQSQSIVTTMHITFHLTSGGGHVRPLKTSRDSKFEPWLDVPLRVPGMSSP